jgi:hypothetical protein
MKTWTWVDWVALISSLTTIISVCWNLIQQNQNIAFKKMLRDRLQAAYNNVYQIAQWSDRIRGLGDSALTDTGTGLAVAFQQATKYAYAINGIADASRNDTIAFCREHLCFVPRYEHPAAPLEALEALAKPAR